MSAKRNNTMPTVKASLRSNALKFVSSPLRVLDVFCRYGEMFNAVYKDAEKYTGIDIDPRCKDDKREVLIGKAEKVLKQIDVNEYNVFDLDAYSDPYQEFIYIVGNLKKEGEYHFFFTESLGRKLRQHHYTKQFTFESKPSFVRNNRLGFFKWLIKSICESNGCEFADVVCYQKRTASRTIYSWVKVVKKGS